MITLIVVLLLSSHEIPSEKGCVWALVDTVEKAIVKQRRVPRSNCMTQAQQTSTYNLRPARTDRYLPAWLPEGEHLHLNGSILPPPRQSSIQQESTPKLKTLQEVGSVERHITITFISSGYTKNEETLFNNDVARAWRTLQNSNPDSLHLDAAPWPRYFPSLNLYSLFEESTESGAFPKSTSNNLQCRYGTPEVKMLQCDWATVLTVGSYAPQTDLYIVLVNDDIYGGTGDPGPPGNTTTGVAVMYNGEDLPLLMIHEVGHAFGGLGDEYSYNVEESRDLNIPNCSPDPKKFVAWADLGLADKNPVQPCGYTNYYKPSESCIMGTSYPRMCAVCKEAMVKSLYRKPIETAAQRCPPPYEVVYLTITDTVRLRVMSNFVENSDVSVTWNAPTSRKINTPDEISQPYYDVSGSDFPVLGEHVVTVTVDDLTPMVLEKTENMKSKSTFTIRRVLDKPINCATKICAGPGWQDPPHCSVCEDPITSRNCSNANKITLKTIDTSQKDSVGVTWGYTLLVGGIILCAGVFTIACAAGFVLRWRKRKILEVVILSDNMQTLQKFLTASTAVVMIGSICSVTVGFYYYEQSKIFGKSLMLGWIVLSGFVMLLSLFLLASIVLRVVPWILICSMLTMVLSIGTLLLGCLLLWTARNIDSPSLRGDLSSEWDSAVDDNPSDVCAFQAYAHCSGFLQSCSSLGGGASLPSFCPKNCELSNRYPDSCYTKLETFIDRNFKPAGGVLLAVTVVLLAVVAGLLTIVMAVLTKRTEMQRRRRHRLLGLSTLDLDESDDEEGMVQSTPLTDEEIAALRIEFNKADKDGSGALDKDEAMLFWEIALGEAPTDTDIETAKSAIDVDGDGKISFEEFVAVYQPFDHRYSSAPARPGCRKMLLADPQIAGSIVPGEVSYLRREFKKLDRNTGVLTSRQQFREWFFVLFCRTPVEEELDWFVGVMDPSRTGRVSFEDFAKPYKNLKQERAGLVRSVLGDTEVQALRREFSIVNTGNDSVLTTDKEFYSMYQCYHGVPGTVQEVQDFTTKTLKNSSGVISFTEFCVPFARRAQRRKKMRDGLTPDGIEAVRQHYQLLEKNAKGDLSGVACAQLYSVLYEHPPTEEALRKFMVELDIENKGVIGFDELLRLFSQTAREAAAKCWLQGFGVTARESEMIQNDYKALVELDEGLQMGVAKDGFATLLRNAARTYPSVSTEPQAIDAAFRSFDEDGDGYLDEVEFTKAYHTLFFSSTNTPPPRFLSTPSRTVPEPSSLSDTETTPSGTNPLASGTGELS
eukprot:TRINITY_DN11107_c0_g1_i1.p1 TRINITY_DN11107_c0_g1~~TRINITY_DN11107_c0_g1_i1.p1  ORF type:complete len:1273 (+),score=152.44 TRINITY_DN11107_c0_g1_i1:68-3886(+)